MSLTGCGGFVPNTATNGTPSASAGSLAASPASVAFGSVTVGSPATAQLSFVNSSADPVVISKMSLSNSVFSVDGSATLPMTLAPKSTTNLNVHFAPTLAGSVSAQLVVASNSLITPSLTIAMTGTGVLKTQPAGGTSSLTVNSSTVNFGSVPVGTPATQSLTLTASGSAAVTVNSVSISGAGFADPGVNLPMTINAGQSMTLNLQFTPAAAGAVTGTATIASNATPGSQTVALNGAGIALAVNLSWDAPSTGDQITGYNIYRAVGTSSSFQRLNSSINSPDTYLDASVQPNTTYQYYVTSVDAAGAESTPSNTATVAVE